jgi:hypothetical protein
MSKSPPKKKSKNVSTKGYTEDDLENALQFIYDGLHPKRVTRAQENAKIPSQNMLAKEASANFGVPFGTLNDNYRKKHGEKETSPKKPRWAKNMILTYGEKKHVVNWIVLMQSVSCPNQKDIKEKVEDVRACRGVTEPVQKSWVSLFVQAFNKRSPRTIDNVRYVTVNPDRLYAYFFKLETLMTAEKPVLIMVMDEVGYCGYNKMVSDMKVYYISNPQLCYRVTADARDHITALQPIVLVLNPNNGQAYVEHITKMYTLCAKYVNTGMGTSPLLKASKLINTKSDSVVGSLYRAILPGWFKTWFVHFSTASFTISYCSSLQRY